MATNLTDDISNDVKEAIVGAMRHLDVRQAKRLAHHVEQALSHTRQEFAHDAGELVHDARESGRDLVRAASREVRAHPLGAVALGAAIGALAGLLITQRK